jgi:hypothetical protein
MQSPRQKKKKKGRTGPQKKKKTRGVSPCGLAIYITKYKAEAEIWKLKYFSMPKYNL